ncbi:LLM class flavin-dependent oxidoreductase [Oceanobacillus massiliensis]|uniref:LLM class flavin-dependent oxidoreductase n=1 Tax=Oceanobacillus massiliensis TaxID=1465765 RepID=UPI000289E19A|nr:LLM class flavin-dependent oxidoreductase [Oceanobacillus massiliensis]
MVRLNILDYTLIDEGTDARHALAQTTELARHADELGYHRFWIPEQHQVFSIASSAPEVLMMHLADSTKTIRIGSGGVMLPHYSPYKVAESFRMLEALHPGRIDLGIGNSSGGRLVNRVLNEEKEERLSYEQQVTDVQRYLAGETLGEHRFQSLIAAPVIKTKPEIWMLGAGGKSTKIAAENGTAYTYAHFIKPFEVGSEIVATYRSNFKPSSFMEKPNVSIAVFVVIGETKEEAEEFAKAFDLWMASLETAKNPPYFPSIATAKKRQYSEFEKQKINQIRKRAIIGNPQYVKEELYKLVEFYHADELTIIPNFPGAANRIKGLQLLAREFRLNKQ